MGDDSLPASRARHLRLAAMALAAVSGSVRADILIGPNGERLPGHVVSQENGVLVFQSDFLGRVEVPSDQARVERDDPIAAGPVEIDVVPKQDAVGPKWTADMSGRLSVDRGSLKTAEDKLGAAFKFVRSASRGELHGALEYNYKRTAGQLKDDDWLASLSYDRFLSERRFNAGHVLGATELADEGYDRTLALSLASGWRLWETPSHYLRIGPALGYVSVIRGESHSNGAAYGLYARATGPLLGRATFNSEFHLLNTLDDGRFASLELRLRQPLGERLYLALAWHYLWNDMTIDPGIKSVWRWELGWRFGAEPKPVR